MGGGGEREDGKGEEMSRENLVMPDFCSSQLTRCMLEVSSCLYRFTASRS